MKRPTYVPSETYDDGWDDDLEDPPWWYWGIGVAVIVFLWVSWRWDDTRRRWRRPREPP